MIKKEFLGMPLSYFLFMAGIALLAIFVGSFVDYQLSQAIVNQETFFGRFVESFGMMLSYFLITLGGVLLFKGLYQNEKLGIKILAYVLLVLSMIATIYFIADGCKNDETQTLFGLGVPTIVSYIIGVIVTAIFALLSFFFFQSEDKELLIRIGACLLIAMLLQWLCIHFIKRLNGRPRYRLIVDVDLNTALEEFRPWWIFKPGSAIDDLHKSWPSGHTGTAVIAILLSTLAPILRFPFKNARFTLFAIGAGYAIIIAFMRIFHGAHFLSDVGFGMLIGTIFALLSVFLCDTLFRNKETKQKTSQE